VTIDSPLAEFEIVSGPQSVAEQLAARGK